MVARRSGKRASEPGRGVPAPAPAPSTRGGGPRRTNHRRGVARVRGKGVVMRAAGLVDDATVSARSRSTTSNGRWHPVMAPPPPPRYVTW